MTRGLERRLPLNQSQTLLKGFLNLNLRLNIREKMNRIDNSHGRQGHRGRYCWIGGHAPSRSLAITHSDRVERIVQIRSFVSPKSKSRLVGLCGRHVSYAQLVLHVPQKKDLFWLHAMHAYELWLAIWDTTSYFPLRFSLFCFPFWPSDNNVSGFRGVGWGLQPFGLRILLAYSLFW